MINYVISLCPHKKNSFLINYINEIYLQINFLIKFLSKEVGDLLQAHLILPRSEIFVISKKSRNQIIYSQLYRTGPEEPIIFQAYGRLNLATSEVSFEKNRFQKRNNLKGISLRAGAVLKSADSLKLYSTYGYSLVSRF